MSVNHVRYQSDSGCRSDVRQHSLNSFMTAPESFVDTTWVADSGATNHCTTVVITYITDLSIMAQRRFTWEMLLD